MLALLLDENLSPEVARQIAATRPDIPIASVYSWQEGRYKGQPDDALLSAAAQAGQTLVTYDQKTILPLLMQWGAAGTNHAGVIFIDDRTIASSNFGALIRALTARWNAHQTADWTNRVDFLRSA